MGWAIHTLGYFFANSSGHSINGQTTLSELCKVCNFEHKKVSTTITNDCVESSLASWSLPEEMSELLVFRRVRKDFPVFSEKIFRFFRKDFPFFPKRFSGFFGGRKKCSRVEAL
jgi:hypothetical protein